MRRCYLWPGTPWTKMTSRLCRPIGTFSNLAQAQTACVQLGSSCHGVYDEHCDGRTLHLCQASPFSTSNAASCVYQANGAISTASRPFTTTAGLRNAVKNYANCWDFDLQQGQATKAAAIATAKAALKSADAVCFDVDSTLCASEG